MDGRHNKHDSTIKLSTSQKLNVPQKNNDAPQRSVSQDFHYYVGSPKSEPSSFLFFHNKNNTFRLLNGEEFRAHNAQFTQMLKGPASPAKNSM